MGDVWLSPVSITATLNQLDCGCYSIEKTSYVWRTCHWSLSHSLDFALTMKQKQRRLGFKMESFSLVTPRLCFRKVNSELDRSFDGENVVFGLELEAEDGLRDRRNKVSFFEDLLVENGVQVKPVVDRKRIHYLEERNEEMLSKTLLKLSRLDKVRSALELFDSMRFLGLQPNAHTCNSFLSCLLRTGDIQKAFTVFEFMRIKENVTGHTHSLMLKAVAEVKGCDSALRMFRELEREPKHKSYFDVVLYNTAISLCGRINNVYETERIWRVMKSEGQIGTEIYILSAC